MKTVRLQVHDGELVGDVPVSLRGGTILHAVIADRDEDMPAEELAQLNRTLGESWDELEATVTARLASSACCALVAGARPRGARRHTIATLDRNARPTGGTTMKRHYRHDAESEHGTGVCYMEITGRWPTRQVEVYGEIWVCADEEDNTHLADQPFENLELEDEHAIAPEEFERVWEEAVRRCRPAT